tara:strand:+ start:705 stop:860 length:156 start_codon:yes stop_codon:yes gene_type:complete
MDRQRELEEDWWYHYNAKCDYIAELKKEHEDPYWDCDHKGRKPNDPDYEKD